MLKKVWNSREIGTSTKVCLYNSNVKSVLLYGAETWRKTKEDPEEDPDFNKSVLTQNPKNPLARNHQ